MFRALYMESINLNKGNAEELLAASQIKAANKGQM